MAASKKREEAARRDRMVIKALRSWTTLNEHVADMTSAEAAYAIEIEKLRDDGPRETFLERLRQRYAAAKAQEAREEIST